MDTRPRPPDPPPRAGELLHITRAASVQFINPIVFRVIRCLDQSTYHGWAWLDGYQLSPAGDAVARREIFVQLAGLVRLPEQPAPAGTRNQRAPRPRGRRGEAAAGPRSPDTRVSAKH